MLTLATLIALVVALDGLRQTVGAWNRVIAGSATLGDLLHLTGFLGEEEVRHRFGAPDENGRYRTAVIDIERNQKRLGRAMADPLLAALVITVPVVALLAQDPPLMIAATVFVILWHVLTRNYLEETSAPRI
ncbi:MAG: hypothetical protein KDI98_00125 [Hyphomicrobiaceae bacterium]|nr:hypothetical protein [Hyphomicrobiaceae bacterium]